MLVSPVFPNSFQIAVSGLIRTSVLLALWHLVGFPTLTKQQILAFFCCFYIHVFCLSNYNALLLFFQWKYEAVADANIFKTKFSATGFCIARPTQPRKSREARIRPTVRTIVGLLVWMGDGVILISIDFLSAERGMSELGSRCAFLARFKLTEEPCFSLFFRDTTFISALSALGHAIIWSEQLCRITSCTCWNPNLRFRSTC